jgi:hypothetical protein
MTRTFYFLLILSPNLSYLQFDNVGIVYAQESAFGFAVTADQHHYSGPGSYDNSYYFRGVVESINALGGDAFMISPGDFVPVQGSEWTIEQVLGSSYLWHPVVGNHELPGNGSENYIGA